MYDLSGIFYQMKANSLLFGFLGLTSIIASRFWNKTKINKKELCLGIFICLFCVILLINHVIVVNNINISMYEGEFIEELRENPYLFRRMYTFKNEDGSKKEFYLDIFSKKKIYSQEFEEEEMYRIYYDDKLKIIVKVEQIVNSFD